jgi:hypothetical protein
MATTLIINDTVVYPDSTLNIKLVRENPYFTQSENYTLDVNTPMDILENRVFFSNIQRMERTKRVESMRCRLEVGNRTMLSGTARVTQVTEKEVKLQLVGGRSEVNFLGDGTEEYIDELPLGKCSTAGVVDTGIRVGKSLVNDETIGTFARHSIFQYNLIDIFRQMLVYYGFELTENTLDVEPWNKIFVASSKNTPHVAHTLPHWTPREFVTEFCNFFNVVLDIDDIRRRVRIISAKEFFSTANVMEVVPEEEYVAETAQGEDGSLASNDISFDMSSSEHHDYDLISDNLRQNAPATEYDSLAHARQAYEAMTGDEGMKQIFRCPVGSYTGWDHDYSDVNEENPRRIFTRIDVFAPLKRGGDKNAETKLKICPVAMAETETDAGFGGSSMEHTITTKAHVPSLENPTGDEWSIQGRFGGNRGDDSSSQDEDTTIQEYIEEGGEIRKGEKEDRLQVMFIDDIPQTYFIVDSISGTKTATESVGFTDWQYKKNHAGNEHRHWSLSLNPTDAEHYLGELHQNGFSFNMQMKLHVKFLSKDVPSPTGLFLIKGKLYGCEKIEANISDGGTDKLLDGYFYERMG